MKQRLEDISKEINNSYGAKYHQPRKFKNKNESAQEAHEAIRPTYMGDHSVLMIRRTSRLYELIWKRTIASQMSEAAFSKKQAAKIAISSNNQESLTASGEVMQFDGFLKVYTWKERMMKMKKIQKACLPPLKSRRAITTGLLKMLATAERFSRPAPRYTEASLVKKLEELGIGRPIYLRSYNFYNSQKRNYVEKRDKDGVLRQLNVLRLSATNEIGKEIKTENTGAEKSKLFPTDLGMVVTDFLKQHFKTVMDYGFTAEIEGEFDEIANGKMKWNKMIDNFYTPFHSNIELTLETAERAKGERELGVDAATGKPVIARMGRYGPMVQIGKPDDEEKPRFAKLKTTQSIETITMDEAMELFKLPITLGDYSDKEVSVNVGRFGPYVKWGDDFISIPKGEDISVVDLDRAIQLILDKQQVDAPIAVYEDKPVTKGKGRFGPFIKWNDLFINIPRAYNFDTLTQADCEALIVKKKEKEANRFIHQWPAEKIAVENGRWGPFIRFGKKMLKLGKKTEEELQQITLEDIKKIIVTQVPDAFSKKIKPTAGAAKKPAVKKAASKKATPKKTKSKK